MAVKSAGQVVAEETREGILLRAGVTFPVEIYTEKRLAEFGRNNEAALARFRLKNESVPILGGAIAGHATHLLTGDEHDFGAYFGKTIQGVKIVSPRMLADELVRRGLL